LVTGLVLLVLLFPATARTQSASCSYDAGTHSAAVLIDAASFRLYTLGGAIRSNWRIPQTGFVEVDAPCGAGTVTNTDRVTVTGHAFGMFGACLGIDFAGGPFAPGFTPEADGTSEIEFDVTMSGPEIACVSVTRSTGNVVMRAGDRGINLNADAERLVATPDVDVTMHGVEQLFFATGAGNDEISGAGGLGTGGPTSIPMFISGGPAYGQPAGGSDRLIGGLAATATATAATAGTATASTPAVASTYSAANALRCATCGGQAPRHGTNEDQRLTLSNRSSRLWTFPPSPGPRLLAEPEGR